MKLSKVKKIKYPIDRLVYWITERESIRLKREKGLSAPWTDDEILQNYRFCNVVRMEDKVSKWLMENWYKPNYDDPNILMACALARHLNKPEILSKIGFPEKYDPDRWLKICRRYIKEGHKCFNSAYIITGKCFSNKRYGTKLETVLYSTIRQFAEDPVDLTEDLLFYDVPDTMKEFVAKMVDRYELIGTFMAGQIAADFHWGTSHTFKDVKYWAAVGPGSRRGMNLIHKRPLKFSLRQPQFEEELQDLIDKLDNRLDSKLRKRMEGIDYQNCLCEISKYDRTLWGNGRPKQKYSPPNSEKQVRGRIG